MKYWEIIADRLSKAGWSLGWVSAIRGAGISDSMRQSAQRDCGGREIKLDKLSRNRSRMSGETL